MTTTQVKPTPEEIASELASYNQGSENFYHHDNSVTYTDGIKYLADSCEAYWLIDLISSYQCERRIRQHPFQVWTMHVDDRKVAQIRCEDGNGHLITRQAVPFTTFPLETITLYLEDGSLDGETLIKVLMLPEER